MPKYLFEVSYTAAGVTGLLKDGGTKRRAAAQALIESVGGKLEALYYTFGERDAFVIAEVPDSIAAAALSLQLGSSGAITNRTTVLLTPEDIDQATKRPAIYTPPGS